MRGIARDSEPISPATCFTGRELQTSYLLLKLSPGCWRNPTGGDPPHATSASTPMGKKHPIARFPSHILPVGMGVRVRLRVFEVHAPRITVPARQDASLPWLRPGADDFICGVLQPSGPMKHGFRQNHLPSFNSRIYKRSA